MKNNFKEKYEVLKNKALNRGEIILFSELQSENGISESECRDFLGWIKENFPEVVIRELSEGGFTVIGNTRRLEEAFNK